MMPAQMKILVSLFPSRLFQFILFLLFILAPLTSPAQEKSRPDYVIKWGTIAPENTNWGDVINKASREIENQTNGRVKWVWYFGAVMGDELDMIRKMRINQLQGLALLSVGLSKLAPEMIAFSLPDLFHSYEEVDCVFERSWPLVEKIMAARGFVIFGRADVGFTVLFSKNDLRTVEDFRKARFWTWEGLEVDKAVAGLFGVENLISLALPEVLTALQTGMVDTVYGTYYTDIALQWNTQVKYMSDPSKFAGAYAPAMLVLKKNLYDSMPPDLQKIIRETTAGLFPPLRKQLRQDEDNAKRSLLKRGIKMMEIDPALIAETKVRAQQIYQKWEGIHYPRWFLQGILTARNQCREDLAK
ncbi:MAG: TRAP transporter substrate-binding protein DctP [bacterium]|nr:TRAP transporter substrate-binding protein DctP [bacterium]